MSCITNPQFEYLHNKNEEVYYNKDYEDDDFNFEYVPFNEYKPKEYKHSIKDVRRQKISDKDGKVWTSFLNQEEHPTRNCQQMYSNVKNKSNRTLAESFEEVDRELMRLQGDSVPETCIRVSNNNIRNNQENNLKNKTVYSDLPMTKEDSADDTNFLLTIPEDKNIHCQTEVSETRKHYKTHIKKSCSDQTFKKNKIDTRRNYSANDIDYNSSPDTSPNPLSDENGSMFENPDPIVVTKIMNIQKKISIVLDSISNELDRVPLPDGENDLNRRKQRTAEFSTRLSRNYLYDLNRQIADIERHIKAVNPDGKMRLSRRVMILHMQVVEQKLISTHQLLLTALSAYCKHIPSAVLKSHPGKLKEILQIVVQLKNICIEIKLIPDFYCSGDDKRTFLGKETENRCSTILSKFRLNSDIESQLPSHTTKSTVINCTKKQRNRKMLSNRLSMYTVDMRLSKTYQSKNPCNRLYIPKDRKYTSALSKHQQRNILPTSKKLQLNSRMISSNEDIKNKYNKITVPIKEDDIQTMMETFPSDLDVDSHQSIQSAKKAEIYKESNKGTEIYKESHKGSAIYKESHKGSDIYRESQKAPEIYDSIKDFEKLKKNRSCVDNRIVKSNDLRDQYFSTLLSVKDVPFIESDYNSVSLEAINAYHNLNKKTVPKMDLNNYEKFTKCDSQSGSSNVRLTSIFTTDNKEENNPIVDLVKQKNTFKFSDVSCQANHLNIDGMFRLKVSDSVELKIIEYRNQHLSLLKSSPMYTSNTQNKPWEVVAWIADKLVDEMIVELSNDFQIEEIIQKLFELEFEEF